MTAAWIEEHEHAWRRRPALREVYRRQIFRPLCRAAPGAPSLEIGSGPGFLAAQCPGMIASDLAAYENVALCCRAEALPFADASLGAVLGVDVLHHLDRPAAFFDELARVLRPGGRAAFAEPWLSPVSRIFWRSFHHESCELSARPWERPFPGAKCPMDGNSALPWQMFCRGAREFQRRWPQLRLHRPRALGGVAWVLSGGFTGPRLLPGALARFAVAIENVLMPVLAPVMTFRALIVIERRPDRRGPRAQA